MDQESLFADYNNDGLNDLYLCNGFGDRLFKNMGSTFEDVTATAGFDVDSEQRSTVRHGEILTMMAF